MNNATLFQCLQDITYNSPPIISDTEVLEIETLVNRVKQLRRTILADAQNNEIAVIVKDTTQFIVALLALDGFANSILILPPDLDNEVQIRLMKQNEIAYYYDGSSLVAFGSLPDVNNEEEAKSKLESTRWILTTSGTTGIPKSIVHSFASLTKTTRMKKGSGFVWGLIYEAYRFAGLQVVLQSLLGGSTLVVANDANFSEQIRVLNEKQVNALSATPSWWRKYLMFESSITNLKRITLGGEITNQQLLDGLTSLHPDARIVHIYASTEAGVGFSVQDGLEGFPAEWLDKEVGEVSLAISADNHLLIKSNDSATGQEVKSRTDVAGYIDTEDLVEAVNDRVKFLGRVSGAINVGGNKVHPEEVEAIIRQLSFVDDVLVIAKKNPLIGELVQAKVCAVSNIQVDKKQMKEQIISHCKELLIGYKVPALITFVDTLDYSKTGKLVRY